MKTREEIIAELAKQYPRSVTNEAFTLEAMITERLLRRDAEEALQDFIKLVEGRERNISTSLEKALEKLELLDKQFREVTEGVTQMVQAAVRSI